MWKVLGIPVPDIVDEVIQWDDFKGYTQHSVLRGGNHDVFVTCIVPREDNYQGRTITRHEFLHAVHDANIPTKLTVSHSPDMGYDRGLAGPVVSGIADAIVHLVYWPAGEDAEADRDAVATAMESLRDLVAEKQFGEAVDWDMGRVLMLVVRDMAILKSAGTPEDQMQGSKLILAFLSAAQLSALNRVLEVVKQRDREGAEKLLAEVVETAAA